MSQPCLFIQFLRLQPLYSHTLKKSVSTTTIKQLLTTMTIPLLLSELSVWHPVLGELAALGREDHLNTHQRFFFFKYTLLIWTNKTKKAISPLLSHGIFMVLLYSQKNIANFALFSSGEKNSAGNAAHVKIFETFSLKMWFAINHCWPRQDYHQTSRYEVLFFLTIISFLPGCWLRV